MSLSFSDMIESGTVTNIIPLLYIRDCKSNEKCPKEYEEKLDKFQELFDKARTGCGSYHKKDNHRFILKFGYKGYHECNCGKMSTSRDYLLENNKYYTNSLWRHYFENHFGDIPKEELDKFEDALKTTNEDWQKEKRDKESGEF